VQEEADLMTKSLALYCLAKPHRDAVIELAEAYASFVGHGGTSFEIAANAKRLHAAQDVFGVELYPRHMLEALELRKDAA
jgi:hypothetical protein